MEAFYFHHMLSYCLFRTGYPTNIVEYALPAAISRQEGIIDGYMKGMNIIIYNSTRLLRAVNILALFTSFIAFLVAVYSIAIRFFSDHVVEGWTTLMLTLSIFFISLFLILTILGEYILRLVILNANAAAYHIVQERHSSVMLDMQALNVREESQGSHNNKVQTGRDR